MQSIMTKYGDIPTSKILETHDDGTMQSCMPTRKCCLKTSLGILTPQYTTDDLRKKELQPVVFHKSGTLRALPLEQQATVLTPAGEILAELITFHPNGNVSRVFPLNGKLSGYWSQEDEAGLAESATLQTPVGTIETNVIGIGFHEDETLRSITLWPGKTLSIPTPAGSIETRTGISFAPNGAIQSLEPARPTLVKTMVGEIVAYDPDAIGINGDMNSLVFNEKGEIVRVATTLTRLTAIRPDGRKSVFLPEYRESLCGDTEQEVVPMILEFNDETVVIRTSPESRPTIILREKHLFFTEPYLPQLVQAMPVRHCSV